MTETVPLALRLARRARLSSSPTHDCSPIKLHKASNGDRELYRHAMIEAGYIIQRATGLPYNPCPSCGWSPLGFPE
jgi:hypothetical protein